MVNLLKAEQDQQKKIFTPQKFNQIDKAHDLIKTLNMEISLIKMDLDAKAEATKTDELDKKFLGYALKRELHDV